MLAVTEVLFLSGIIAPVKGRYDPLTVVIANLVVDLLYAVLDPRIRLG